jgi:hypothetical protein
MRKFFGTIAAVALVAVSAQGSSAQGFTQGYLDIGPTIGLGGIGDAGIALGARLEKGIKPLESLGGGMLGIQAGFDYYSYDFGFGGNLTYIPIGVTANYHFKLSDQKFDPFVGLGLGFEIVTCDFPGSTFGCDVYDSGIYFIGRAGARYFFSDKMAFYGDLGAGAATISLGIMFKLK